MDFFFFFLIESKYNQVTLLLFNLSRFCNFTHVKRLGNSVAHFLARKSISGSKLHVWMEFVPDDIAPFVVCDAL